MAHWQVVLRTTIKIWDTSSGTCIKTLKGHTGWVYSLCLLTDGTLASGSGDKNIKIWDTSSGTCIKTLQGHTSDVNSLCLLTDGTLASGSHDSTIKIWDIKDIVILCSLRKMRQLTQEEEEESPIAITVMTAEDTTTLRVSPYTHIAECLILACREFGLCWTKHILLLGGDPLLPYRECGGGYDDHIYTLVDDDIQDGAHLHLRVNSEATDSRNFQVVVDRA